MAEELFAIITTNVGEIELKLFPDRTPKTVRNFVGLAEGTKEWTDPRTGKSSSEPLFDGTIFHRVIKGFMIQGGDRSVVPELAVPARSGDLSPTTFDWPYLLAMINADQIRTVRSFRHGCNSTKWLTHNTRSR